MSKKARDEVEARVFEKKQFQEKIDTRLLTLDTICIECGLNVPLTRGNINHFLMETDDDIYLQKLVSLINNEISRLNKAEELKRVQETRIPKEDNNTLHKQENPLKDQTRTKKEKAPTEYAHFKNLQEFTPVKRKGAKKTFVVTATFEVEFDETKAYQLESLLKDKFLKANFKQIPYVEIHEKEVRYAS